MCGNNVKKWKWAKEKERTGCQKIRGVLAGRQVGWSYGYAHQHGRSAVGNERPSDRGSWGSWGSWAVADDETAHRHKAQI
jgi:hypothetical protein